MSASNWGHPNATKHVLLIHGLSSSSHSWHRIAVEFASRGYFVTAPDLLGHGHARRGTDYTIAALAHELEPYLDHPYDIVVGHSLGGVVASALLPLFKSTRSVQVVLVDPPFEQTPERTPLVKEFLRGMLTNPKTPESYQEMYPLATKEDVIGFWLSARLVDIAAVDAILDQNNPWSFSHHLQTVPDNVQVTVLAADPSKVPCVREEDLKPYPHVTAKTVWGCSHLIPIEAPQVVIETALKGTESQN